MLDEDPCFAAKMRECREMHKRLEEDAPLARRSENRTIGDYRIIREVGRGGMGIVYEARQLSLERKVALKVISSSLGLSSKAVLRFRREAQAAAKLHHTNIVPIYATGEQEGIHFYAMEFIEGPSLEQVLRQLRSEREGPSRDAGLSYDSGTTQGLPPWVSETFGAVPLTDSSPSPSKASVDSSALKADARYFDTVAGMIASVADALDHAHESGVVHRDVKPANLLLAPDGRLSINDFGLARMLEQPGMTVSGELVGSPLYMSPEQITAGRAPLDHRTDIYSLGATLYELLTLRSPFLAQGRDEVIALILYKDPEPPRRFNKRIPVDLETICLKAMEKDPDRRYPTAALMAEDLRRYISRFAVHARRPGPLRHSIRFIQRHRVAAAACAAGVVVASIVGVAIAWSFWPEPRLSLSPPQQITWDTGLSTEPTLSADGRLLAYASDCSGRDDSDCGDGNLDVWVQELEAGRRVGPPRRLTTDPADDREPDLSPDGSLVAFRSERRGGGIYLVGSNGGEESLLAPQGRGPRFSPDGRHVAYWVGHVGGAGGGEIFIVGTETRIVVPVEPQFTMARNPVWSPDGRYLLFVGRKSGSVGATLQESDDWWLTAVTAVNGGPVGLGAFDVFKASGIPVGVSNIGPFPGAWSVARVFYSGGAGNSQAEPRQDGSNDGKLLVSAVLDQRNLWFVPVSPEDGRIVGVPRILTNTTSVFDRLSLGGENLMVFASETADIDLWSLPVAADEGRVLDGQPLRRLNDDPGPDVHPVVSSDGRSVLFQSNRSGTAGVWILDVETRHFRPIADLPDEWESFPTLSSDGTKVAFRKRGGIYVTSVDPGGAVELLSNSTKDIYSWTRDGAYILATRGYCISVATGEEVALLENPEVGFWNFYSSPDGKWITFNEASGTRSRIFVAPCRPGNPPSDSDWILISDRDGDGWDDKPRWSPDGNLLYFISEREECGGYRCIWARRLHPETKQPDGPPFDVYHFHEAQRSLLNIELGVLGMSVARDKIVFTLEERRGNVWRATLEER